MDGAIRILGSRRKLASKNGNSSASIPGYLREYLEAVANRHSLAPAALVNDVVNHLRNHGYINQFVVEDWMLSLQPPGDLFHECPQCRRVHLHPAGEICTDCLRPLGQPQQLGTNVPDEL